MKQLLLTIFLISTVTVFGQEWVDKMMTPGIKLEKASESFNDYWKGKEYQKGQGHKQFKRWEYFVSRRLNENGTFGNSQELYQALQEWVPVRERAGQNRDLTQRWKPLGPFVNPQGNQAGIGRVNDVTFHPTEVNEIWMGTPAGGAWRTTNYGESWTCMTEYLPGLGVSDIEFDPNNPEVIYIATGDRDAGDTYAFGIMKSIDGGQSWNTTGLSFNLAQNVRGNKVLVDPRNSNIVIAATSNGIYRSEDAGVNWIKTSNGSTNYSSMERNPENFDVLYASAYQGSSFIRSNDGGLTWEAITDGLSGANGARRGQIALTEANPDVVYIIYCTQQFGLQGIFKSIDAGLSFEEMTDESTPNILANSPQGAGTGGQGWYDLAIAASPDDENELYVGGVNIWKSTDGGQDWELNTYWQNFPGFSYSHADHHWLAFHPVTRDLWNGNDGGVFITQDQGQTWSDFNADFNITQYYRLAVSQTNPDVILGGAQDNGTDLFTAGNGIWRDVNGGDGMNNAISPTNDNIMIVSSQYGGMRRSTNGGASFGSVGNLPTGSGAWITPFEFDPTDPEGLTVYAGFQSLYKSVNGGGAWTIVQSPYNGANLEIVHISKANRDHLIIGDPRSLYLTRNGGDTWSNIGSQLNGTISWVETHPEEPGRIWVTLAGFSAGNKVMYSDDFGQNWTNISGNLPNVPVNCVEFEDGSDNRVYVGTDIGVFYKDDFTDKWQDFNIGLPAVIIDELEIQYSENVMRAATYGRGVWEIDLLEKNGSPQANFTVSKQAVCVGDSIQFQQGTSFGFQTMEWDFNNDGTIDATGENVTYAYAEPGIYNVRVIASGDNGTDTLIKERYITIEEFIPTLATYEETCANAPLNLSATGGVAYNWEPRQLFTSPFEFTTDFITDKDTTVSVTVSNAIGCQKTLELFVDVIDAPETEINNLSQVYCAADEVVEVEFLPVGGLASGTGIDGNSFNPAEGDFGLRTVNYEFTDETTGCTGFISQDVYINPETPEFLTQDIITCDGDSKTIELASNNDAAVFTGEGVEGNLFNSEGLSPGEYTISLEVNEGDACDGTDQLTVTVRDLPTITFTNLDDVYCSNSNLILIETEPSGAEFDGPGFISGNRWLPSRAGEGTHIIIAEYSDEFGCTNTVESSVEVVEGPENPTIARQGNVLAVINAGSNTVEWYTENDEFISEGALLEVSENGVYKAIMSNEFDCESEMQEFLVTGIAVAEVNTINAAVYPNPTIGTLNIVLANSNLTTYQIVNINGEAILSGSITDLQHSLDVSGLANGAYILNLVSSEGNATFPLIKK